VDNNQPLILVDFGDQGDTLDGCKGASEDDKILLNYLEHVSCARVGCLTC
jgi:hypothetical protein